MISSGCVFAFLYKRRTLLLLERIGAMGFISDLPEQILQHILFFMPLRNAACTSILSRTWLSAWNPLPLMTFNFNPELASRKRLPCGTEKVTQTDDFVKFVDESLSILKECKVKVKKFEMAMQHIDAKHVSNLEKLITLATGNWIEELDIKALDIVRDKCFRLLRTTFAGKSLVTLKLSGCKLQRGLLCQNPKIICWRKLSLRMVTVESQFMKKLIVCFPLLEELVLEALRRIRFIQIQGLPKLQRAEISKNKGARLRVEIDAPNLHTFKLSNPSNKDVFNRDNLKKLYLNCYDKNCKFIAEILSRFPLLEDLSISSCKG